MFSNKELLQERINELDNAILNYKDDKINIFSFTTKERMLDCFINSNFCFSSQGVYDKNDIDFESIKASATFITTDADGRIKIITNENVNNFTNKNDAINCLSFCKQDEEAVLEDEALVENIEYSEDVLENSNDYSIVDDLYKTVDYDKVLAIDFETANEFHDKACSVGIALYEKGEISLSKEFLINPETYFNKSNISIHKITEDMVKDSPIFPVIWKNIFDIIDERTLVIAHNAIFDITLLKKLISIYKCEYKEFDYLCTQNLYRSNVKLNAYNLKEVGTHIGTSFEHHRASDDSLVCLKAFLHIINEEKLLNRNLIENEFHTRIERFTMTDENLKYTAREKKQSNFNRFNTNGFKAKDLKPQSAVFDESHPVFGKVFTFTGDFTNFSSKKEAAQKIVDLGGIFKDGLVKANDYLVQGINLNTGKPMDGSKIQKAIDYNNKGCNIEIISEFELMNLLSIKSLNEPETEIEVKEISEETLAIDESKEITSKSTDIISNAKNIETIEKITPKESFKHKAKDTQLSMFDLMLGEDNSSSEEEIKKEEVNLSNIDAKIQSLIAPKGDFIRFETEEEKLIKLKEYKLISAKATACDKPIYYKGIYSDNPVICNIIGYLDLDVLVLEIDGSLHSIRGEYLKQMQDSNFSIFES